MYDEWDDDITVDVNEYEDDWDIDEIEIREEEFSLEEAEELLREVENETSDSLYDWYVREMMD